MNGKKVVFAILSGIALLATTACGTESAKPASSQPQDAQKLSVYTTIYPLEFVAERIGGEYAEVKNIVPPGVEPHDFEPTAKDIVAVSNGNVFIYNGSGFEPWVEKAVEGFDKTKMAVVNTTDGLSLLKAGEEGEQHDHAASSSQPGGTETQTQPDDQEHGAFDPHVWLDPTMLKKQAETVKNAFIKADKAHSSDFEKNYEKLEADLDALDKDFKAMVDQSPNKEFMVSHQAFGYLAHHYGLEQVAISGLSPEAEPSAAELKELVEHVKEHNIKYVLFETLASPKVAEVIAREANVQTTTLNPLEGLTEDEAKAGKDYISIMRENLETLRTVLK